MTMRTPASPTGSASASALGSGSTFFSAERIAGTIKWNDSTSNQPKNTSLKEACAHVVNAGQRLEKAYLESLSLDELLALREKVRDFPDGASGVEVSWIIDSSGSWRLESDDEQAEDDPCLSSALSTLLSLNESISNNQEIFSNRFDQLSNEFEEIYTKIELLRKEQSL